MFLDEASYHNNSRTSVSHAATLHEATNKINPETVIETQYDHLVCEHQNQGVETRDFYNRTDSGGPSIGPSDISPGGVSVPQEPGDLINWLSTTPSTLSPGGVNKPKDPGSANNNSTLSPGRVNNPEDPGNIVYIPSSPGGVHDPQEPGSIRLTVCPPIIPETASGRPQVNPTTLRCSQVPSDKVDSGADNSTMEKVCHPVQDNNHLSFVPSFDPKALSEHATRIKTFWPEPTSHAMARFPQFCELYNRVKSFSAPNAVGARITLDSGLNLEEWESRLQTYHDKEICAYLRFGWPVGYTGSKPPVSVNRNHPSGDNFKSHVQDFLTTECNYGAILGPFDSAPFAPWVRISPIMSRPKKQSDKRRIIIDLTYPEGSGVNSGIDIHSIFGRDISYKLPSIWDLVAYLQTIPQGAWIWVADLQRAYRQLRVDPIDTPLLGLCVDHRTYLDLCPAFGCRSSSAACQRTSNAVVYLMACQGHKVYAYLDDYAGCSQSQQEALIAYTHFKDLAKSLGLQLAADKCRPPATIVTWLGYTIDTTAMQLAVPKDKLTEILDLCRLWLNKSRVNKKTLQSFVGKILHVVPCIRHSRKFTSRMLAALRAMQTKNWTTIGPAFKADVAWFHHYAAQANGISIFNPDIDYTVQIECDACLTGGGGNTDKHFYSWVFTPEFAKKYTAIHQIEAINIVVAFRTLCPQTHLQGKGVLIFTDNISSSYALSTGVTKDPVLAACARELWLEAASKDVELKIKHKPGSMIPLADALSRASSDYAKRSFALSQTQLRGLSQLPPVLKGYKFFTANL